MDDSTAGAATIMRSIETALAEAADPNVNLKRRATLLAEPARVPVWCPIVSVDDHVVEPAALFESVPRRYRDLVPRLIERPDGRPAWSIDGELVPIVGMNGASGRPMTEWNRAALDFDEMREGVWNPARRLHDMDLNGVWASLNFPSVIWGFAGSRFARMRDSDVGLACVKAYNDWMLDGWCGSQPDRFIPCQIAWLGDPIAGAAEIRRNAARGFRAVSFTENPEGQSLPSLYSAYWDPFLAACEETGTVINLHVGSSGMIHRPSRRSPEPVMVALFPLSGAATVVDWIFAKVPLRFPSLRIVLSEGGASWVPMVIERLRRAWRQVGVFPDDWSRQDGDPVELLHRNFYFASIEDPSAFRFVDLIGADKIMIESDYPHSDSSWPTTQELVRSELEHLDTETIHAICHRNACAIYRWPEAAGSFGAGLCASH